MTESLRKRKLDTQLVELAGKNWLASELMRAGIEVARPERDRGIDLIAYVDLDERVGDKWWQKMSKSDQAQRREK